MEKKKKNLHLEMCAFILKEYSGNPKPKLQTDKINVKTQAK